MPAMAVSLSGGVSDSPALGTLFLLLGGLVQLCVRAFAFFIVFCFVVFSCCLFEACSFLVGDGGGVDPGEWGGWGSWEDWREGKLVRIYCMREKSISSLKKKKRRRG